MSKKLVHLKTVHLQFLHDAIIRKFEQQEGIDASTIPDYQLYGYHSEDEYLPSIRKSITNQYSNNSENIPPSKLLQSGRLKINGKYLRDLAKEKATGPPDQLVTVSRDYLDIFLFYLGYESLDSFLEASFPLLFKSSDSEYSSEQPSETPQKSVGFNIFYFDKEFDKVKSCQIRFSEDGSLVVIENSPQGRSYTGQLSQRLDSENHLNYTLYTDEKIAVPSRLELSLCGKTPIKGREIMIGYFLESNQMISSSGRILFERTSIDENLVKKTSKSQSAREIIEDAFIHPLSKTGNRGLYNMLETSARFDSIPRQGPLSPETKKEFICKLEHWKRDAYNQFLSDRESPLSFAPLESLSGLINYLDREYAQWNINSVVKRWLTGKYSLLIGGWEWDEQFDNHEYKIEVITIKLESDGKAQGKTIRGILYTGFYAVVDQRLLQIKLSKKGGLPSINLFLEAPRNYDPLKESEPSEKRQFIFRGIAAGLSNTIKPRAEKAILVKQLSGKEVKLPEEFLDPKYIDLIEDEPLICRLEKKIPALRKFFSLDAPDRYIQGSNRLFSHILEFKKIISPIQSPRQGKFFYYRINRFNNAIKRYPFTIKPDGSILLDRKDSHLTGRAIAFNRFINIYFVDPVKKEYKGVLHWSSNHPRCVNNHQYEEAILSSYTGKDQAFSNRVIIRKYRDEHSEEKSIGHTYQRVNFDKIVPNQPFAPQPEMDFFREAALLLTQGNYGIFPHFKEPKKHYELDALEGRSIEKVVKMMIGYYLFEESYNYEQAAAQLISMSLDPQQLQTILEKTKLDEKQWSTILKFYHEKYQSRLEKEPFFLVSLQNADQYYKET